MLKNLLKIVIVFLIGVAGGVFADQFLWPYFIESPLFYYKYQFAEGPIYLTEKNEIAVQENVVLQDAVEKVERSVVGITVETKKGKNISGSGLVVTSDGLMVTLAELVPADGTSTLFIGDKNPEYEVLKRDLEKNLALIKVEDGDLSTVGFADLGELRRGERVFLMGVVFDEKIPLKMVNEGIVKLAARDYIQTNIFEEYTLQGSPLFNIKGELVGLSTISQGKVIAIPVTQIRDFVEF